MTRMIFYPQYYKKAPKLNTEIQSKIQNISPPGGEEPILVTIPGKLGDTEYQIASIVTKHQESIENSQTIYILHTKEDSPETWQFSGWVNILRDRIIAHAPTNRSGRKIEILHLANTVASAPQRRIHSEHLQLSPSVAAAPPKPSAAPQAACKGYETEAILNKPDLGAKTPLLRQPSHSKAVREPFPCTIQ